MYILHIWERFRQLSIQLTQPHKRSKASRYLFPLLLIILIFPIKLILQLNFIEGAPYLLSTFIVILSAWYGGIVPGIIATFAAGILSNFLFLEPRFAINVSSILTTIIFIIQGLFISMISEAKMRADLQKDEFISFASHELKNPLSIIKGYLSLLQKKTKNKKNLEYLFISEIYTDKVTTLINELLDVTKIESGKLSLHMETFSVFLLLKGIVRDQQLLSTTHKILLHGKTSKKIYGDKLRISQIITNLITNAIKYSPQKKNIIVTISDENSDITISVQDFGIGLSEDTQNKIFDRFYRVPGTQTQGLGLGLFIAQKIALLHKGKLELKSAQNKGSTFYLSLPEYKKRKEN